MAVHQLNRTLGVAGKHGLHQQLVFVVDGAYQLCGRYRMEQAYAAIALGVVDHLGVHAQQPG